MSSVEVEPSKTTIFVGSFTVFTDGRITAVGGEFAVVVVETVVTVVVLNIQVIM